MSKEMLNDFFSKQTDEDSEKLNKAINEASEKDNNYGDPLKRSGDFRMRVLTKKYKNKNDEIKIFPSVGVSGKGNLMLNIMLETVGSVDGVKEGSYTYEYITLSPKPGSSDKKYGQIAGMAKSRLAALIGSGKLDDISFDEEFITENLLATFKKDGDNYVVKRDHKMKNEVMVTYEDDEYNNQPTLNMRRIVSAEDGDVSRPNAIVADITKEANKAMADEASEDYDAIAGIVEEDPQF